MLNVNYLYKYTTCEAAYNILSSLHLRWSCPINFNDPFDTRGGILNFEAEEFAEAFQKKLRSILHSRGEIPFPQDTIYYHQALEFRQLSLAEMALHFERMNIRDVALNNFKLLEKRTEEIWEKLKTKMIVLCLSENENDPLMWSHYADSHKGVVIKFRNITGSDTLISEASKINYSGKLPVFSVTLDEYVDEVLKLRRVETEKHELKDQLYSKSKVWEYENEWRCVKLKNPSINEYYEYVPFDPNEIDSVFLGCKMCKENEKRIRKTLVEELKHVNLYKAELEKRSYILRLEKDRR